MDKFIDATYHWYDISDKCYDSIFDGMIAAEAYTTFLKDATVIQQNMIYNFGLVYNNLKELILYFEDDPRKKITGAFSCGLTLGAFFYYFLSDQSVVWQIL